MKHRSVGCYVNLFRYGWQPGTSISDRFQHTPCFIYINRFIFPYWRVTAAHRQFLFATQCKLVFAIHSITIFQCKVHVIWFFWRHTRNISSCYLLIWFSFQQNRWLSCSLWFSEQLEVECSDATKVSFSIWMVQCSYFAECSQMQINHYKLWQVRQYS